MCVVNGVAEYEPNRKVTTASGGSLHMSCLPNNAHVVFGELKHSAICLQVVLRGRKAKHIAHFKGPAKVIKQLSNTTFAIAYRGSTYGRCRCSSELRAYNITELPNLPTREDAPTQLQIHNFVER